MLKNKKDDFNNLKKSLPSPLVGSYPELMTKVHEHHDRRQLCLHGVRAPFCFMNVGDYKNKYFFETQEPKCENQNQNLKPF